MAETPNLRPLISYLKGNQRARRPRVAWDGAYESTKRTLYLPSVDWDRRSGKKKVFFSFFA